MVPGRASTAPVRSRRSAAEEDPGDAADDRLEQPGRSGSRRRSGDRSPLPPDRAACRCRTSRRCRCRRPGRCRCPGRPGQGRCRHRVSSGSGGSSNWGCGVGDGVGVGVGVGLGVGFGVGFGVGLGVAGRPASAWRRLRLGLGGRLGRGLWRRLGGRSAALVGEQDRPHLLAAGSLVGPDADDVPGPAQDVLPVAGRVHEHLVDGRGGACRRGTCSSRCSRRRACSSSPWRRAS